MEVLDESKRRDLRLVVLTALHSAVKSIDHLSDVLKDVGKGTSLENTRLHRTKSSKFISAVIAPAFLTELITDIGDFRYSIIADESTDISSTKFMALCVRYFSKTKKIFIVDFLGLLEVTNCTGKALAGALLEYLDKIRLPAKRMKSIGVDGAFNMCGQWNSYTHLRGVVPVLIWSCLDVSFPRQSGRISDEDNAGLPDVSAPRDA